MVKVEDYFVEEEEKFEEVVGSIEKTGYPDPISHYKLLYEKFNNSVEESYYWIMQFLQHGPIGGHPEVIKVTDLFSASEQSAFFGSAQSRLGLQQDKVSQFMATVGKMVKELFQLVRELRVIDERLDMYNKSTDEKDLASEIALKGYWIDLVEGGAKNPASVYGMARELQFATLPDLFFGVKPIDSNDVEETVEKLDFNKKVKEVLMRKLKTFLTWKKHTHKELNNRRNFTIKFLRQHWSIIHMYMSWVKPYLLNIKRMRLNQKDIERNPNLVSAFEGSIVEVEYLARRNRPGSDYNAVTLVHFWFRTAPKMDYHQQEYHHKGPIHVGKLIINFRSYAWTDQDIQNYLKMREDENLELIGEIDSSVKAAMESLGDELRDYLIEAGETDLLPPEKQKKKTKKKSKLDNPFVAVFSGFGELFGSLVGMEPGKAGEEDKKKKKKKDKNAKNAYKLSGERASATGDAKTSTWNVYKNFKKAHKMLAW